MMRQTQKTKPDCLVIELLERGFSLFAKKDDADILARLFLQSSLSYYRKESDFPGVDTLNFFYVTERARAELILTQYRAEKLA
jgi:hypothetical protein